MAHIASCMANIEPNSISKPASPSSAMLSSSSPPKNGIKLQSWKTSQQDQSQKYQLFPKDKPLPVLNTGKALPVPKDTDSADRSQVGGLRIRLNQNNLIRRRKVSVPELGPMTTVQEISMDSPTIPGRPPLHERSISAPEDPSALIGGIDQVVQANLDTTDDLSKAIDDAFELCNSGPHHPSPKRLAPLVIPASSSPVPRLQSKHSATQLRSGSTPPSDTLKSGRFELSSSSHGRYTPVTGASTPEQFIPRSAPEATPISSLQTPISAPGIDSHRSSPRPWDGSSAGSEDGSRTGRYVCHRRGGSESSSIMDRGRPRMRNDSKNNMKCSDSKTKSSERRAFEELPTGWKPCEAISKMHANEVMQVHKQALGQAERFEVLRAEDVDAMSKELRQLDERTEYLRRTYTSLRAGRRNLHSRICQYLRSPRVAKFSHDSMLRQEEALAELDASIDDWVTKLEQAENRRTRVRQKLLEHVAAAAILPIPDGITFMPLSHSGSGGAPCPGVSDMSTPPRSPVKQSFTSPRASPSPQRVVAQVPSTILEHPVIEEEAATSKDLNRAASTTTLKRSDVESIRVYAGDDLYALLADVEDEITRLSRTPDELRPSPLASTAPGLDREQQKSQEKLRIGKSGSSPSAPTSTTAAPSSTAADSANAQVKSSRAPTPPMKDSPKTAAGLLLTSAVFKP